MKKIIMSCIFIVFFLVSCQTMSSRDKFLSEGARLLSQEELINLYKGNTIKGVASGIKFTTLHREDGIKLIRIGGKVTERKWWINENGQYCETIYKNNTKRCNIKLYENNGIYRLYKANGSRWVEFKMEKGNTENL